MWRSLLPVGIFGVLAVFFFFALKRDPTVIPSPLIDKPAPQFALSSAHDPQMQVSSSDYRGRPYVLNVWATWCVGCRQEHGALLAIARSEAQRGAGGVPIIGLAWKDKRELVQNWLGELGDPYAAVAFDPDGKTAIDWGVYAAPETFLVGADGRVLYKHIAPMTLEVWTKEFLPRIRPEQAGAR